ncbi:MAG: VWA domain-containing protein [Candidatus Obscuribacterales bacterium]|nr:VWA domain-containing protein [Candidatus Obscuribacterales bacterium]
MWKNLFGGMHAATEKKAATENGNALNRVDLCFVVDNTGSMGAFIEAAKAQLIDVIARLSGGSDLNLQIGLVAYRDHPPQDNSFVTKVTDLTSDMDSMRKAIHGMRADGGGDTAEAVYQGLFDTAAKISWRDHSCRFAILVGDAPPHGFVQFYNRLYPSSAGLTEGDAWRDGCPSQLDVHRVAAEMERKGITLHAICQGKSLAARTSFSLLASSTGGTCVSVSTPQEIIDRIVVMLSNEFKDLTFDAKVLEAARKQETLDAEVIGRGLESTRIRTASALARLGKRGFLN